MLLVGRLSTNLEIDWLTDATSFYAQNPLTRPISDISFREQVLAAAQRFFPSYRGNSRLLHPNLPFRGRDIVSRRVLPL